MIFVLDKPSGMTSHNAVSRMKRALGQKIKIGHTGTLDPMCTGVLPILTGNDTKLSDLLDGDKEYVASMKLGVLTDTQDITGTILEERAADGICEADVRAELSSFCGDREQLPPMYSSVKVGGKKLYELAERKGSVLTVVPITALHAETLERKKYWDMTANNINHPNDMLIRMYAQTFAEVIAAAE